MYTFGSSLEPLAMDDDEEKPDSSTSHFMTNTSRIDVTEPPDSTKLLRYPSFLKDVVPVAQQAVLEEGDLLFMPPECVLRKPWLEAEPDLSCRTAGGTR